eukprot:CAMPEP_0206507586 /NCGR_PEP_ID=MMETSP0324_2-20121206/57631_1 /ASSEMBLY_ACC=CAM_ASM_000836 /TAXON_ID=2866 /ORGANISM="Crypthecodinium cohnii, Strain Seligo" /LENGTH=131 /DNA_ID=CAMNT_0053997899 /DNA_START=27 /DNA_END=420 /DNA_ORIENTATION=-
MENEPLQEKRFAIRKTHKAVEGSGLKGISVRGNLRGVVQELAGGLWVAAGEDPMTGPDEDIIQMEMTDVLNFFDKHGRREERNEGSPSSSLVAAALCSISVKNRCQTEPSRQQGAMAATTGLGARNMQRQR